MNIENHGFHPFGGCFLAVDCSEAITVDEMILCSTSSSSALPRTITIFHSHATTVSRQALDGSLSSNLRHQDAKTTENAATDLRQSTLGVRGSNLITSTCSMFKSSNSWDPALESTLESIYSSWGLTPLQAMNVIIFLENPELGFHFFKFTKIQLGIKHLPNIYNVIIVSLGCAGIFKAAMRTLEDMKNSGHFLTESILITLVTCQAHAGKVDEAIELFKHVEAYNCKPSISSYILWASSARITSCKLSFNGHDQSSIVVTAIHCQMAAGGY